MRLGAVNSSHVLRTTSLNWQHSCSGGFEGRGSLPHGACSALAGLLSGQNYPCYPSLTPLRLLASAKAILDSIAFLYRSTCQINRHPIHVSDPSARRTKNLRGSISASRQPKNKALLWLRINSALAYQNMCCCPAHLIQNP